MAKYLVTGGCGFIGSHLADALIARGHAVRIVDDLSTGRIENKPAAAELYKGDVADPDLVATAMRGMDGCFHLAAVASVERSNIDWSATHRTNLTGSITVFDAARRANARLCHTGGICVVRGHLWRQRRRTAQRNLGHAPALRIRRRQTRLRTPWPRGVARARRADLRVALLQCLWSSAGSGLSLFGCDLDLLRSYKGRTWGRHFR